MDIRRLLDRIFDTSNFTDEQLLDIWKEGKHGGTLGERDFGGIQTTTWIP